MKNFLYGILKNVWKKHIDRVEKKVYKKICKQHPEWNRLTSYEKKGVRKQDYYIITLFKNLYGYSENFVSDAIYKSELLPRLNYMNYNKFGIYDNCAGYYEDKNYMDFFLHEFMKMPNIIIRCINGNFYDKRYKLLSKEEVYNILNGYEELILKYSVGSRQGKGVQRITANDYKNIGGYGKNFVVQEILKQHKLLSVYNDSSINVVRITTLNLRGKVEILSGVLRIGAPGALRDLESKDGVNCRIVGIDDKGFLKGQALDYNDLVIYKDIFGKEIKGSIPFYEEMKTAVIGAHQKFSKFGIIGWDLSVDENGELVCIEYNVGCPAILSAQILNGPIFGKITKSGRKLIEEIYML